MGLVLFSAVYNAFCKIKICRRHGKCHCEKRAVQHQLKFSSFKEGQKTKYINSELITNIDRYQVWRSHEPMSVQTFDFCGKKSCHTPFFHFSSFSLKRQNYAISFLKRHNFLWFTSVSFTTLLPGYPSSDSPGDSPGDPPGDSPGHLMLPNLTK